MWLITGICLLWFAAVSNAQLGFGSNDIMGDETDTPSGEAVLLYCLQVILYSYLYLIIFEIIFIAVFTGNLLITCFCCHTFGETLQWDQIQWNLIF